MDKCHICNSKFKSNDYLLDHYLEDHSDQIPEGWSVHRFYYYQKTGKDRGRCVVCHEETNWNDYTNKYHRFCKNPKCKDKYREEFKNRMVGKYGKTHLLNDPNQQRKMLSGRSISGTYRWSDGKDIGFTGSYEKDFLQFLDVFLNFSSDDIISPSPHTYYYEYEGETKFYIPDFFIPSLNLEIEIKDGGDNPNNHHKIQKVDKKKEMLKDKTMSTQKKINYIKVVNKEYGGFMGLLEQMKDDFIKYGEKSTTTFHIISESMDYLNEMYIMEFEPVLENADVVIQNFTTFFKVYPEINTSNVTFDEIEKTLKAQLNDCKSKAECVNLEKNARNVRKMLLSLPKNDASLKPEVHKIMTWIDSTFIPNVNIKKYQYQKRESFKRG